MAMLFALGGTIVSLVRGVIGRMLLLDMRSWPGRTLWPRERIPRFTSTGHRPGANENGMIAPPLPVTLGKGY
jgi:hypothetical protein